MQRVCTLDNIYLTLQNIYLTLQNIYLTLQNIYLTLQDIYLTRQMFRKDRTPFCDTMLLAMYDASVQTNLHSYNVKHDLEASSEHEPISNGDDDDVGDDRGGNTAGEEVFDV